MRLVDNDYTGPGAATLGCPSPDVLMALGGDALPDEIRVPAEAHVARCAACRALLPDLDALDQDVPATLDQRVLGETTGGAAWKSLLLPMAAVLVAAVALGVWYRNSQSPAEVVATSAPPAPEAAPPSQAAGQWSITKPALLLPLATAVVVRGEAEETARALAEALAPYRTDDYVEAERRLEGVVQKYPASADAWFYLGSTRLLDGDAAGARDALAESRAKGVGDRDDEVAWLLATAEARLGELAAARTKLTTLCDGAGAFKAPACAALDTLK
jgi:hypothetical protein